MSSPIFCRLPFRLDITMFFKRIHGGLVTCPLYNLDSITIKMKDLKNKSLLKPELWAFKHLALSGSCGSPQRGDSRA